MLPPIQGRPPLQPNMYPPTWGNGPMINPTPVSGIQRLLQKIGPNPFINSTGIKTGGGLTQSLANLQQILKMTQSVTPLIQQYGPIVKNLPSMLSLLKAFQETEEDGEEENIESMEEDTTVETKLNEHSDTKTKASVVQDNLYIMETDPSPVNRMQPMKPKLYI